jgi:hypothetical protein
MLREDKANYTNVVSHVKGFEEGIIECELHCLFSRILGRTFHNIH